MITIDDFKKVEIRAGKIISAEPVEGSEKLLRLSVDFGPASVEGFGGTKQVISGIAKFISPTDLAGITCTFVTNLEPREIMGLKSEAMIMALSDSSPASEFFSLLKVPDNVPPGSIVK
jgi:methionine--tRNA ligase beta chain